MTDKLAELKSDFPLTEFNFDMSQLRQHFVKIIFSSIVQNLTRFKQPAFQTNQDMLDYFYHQSLHLMELFPKHQSEVKHILQSGFSSSQSRVSVSLRQSVSNFKRCSMDESLEQQILFVFAMKTFGEML